MIIVFAACLSFVSEVALIDGDKLLPPPNVLASCLLESVHRSSAYISQLLGHLGQGCRASRNVIIDHVHLT